MPYSDVDYYKILGVTRHATDDEIKRAFRRLARDTHPDKNPNDPTAKDRFQELQQAYDTLKDALERSKYDEDNQTHGYHGSSAYHQRSASAHAKSATAKRYTATTATPSWAHSSTAKARNFKFYNANTSTTGWDPEPDREYEDMYSSSRRGESAYARTSTTRGATGTPRSHSAKPSRAETSTPSQGPDINWTDYIKEKREQEIRAATAAAKAKEKERQKERERGRESDSSRSREERKREKERLREETKRREEQEAERAKYSNFYYGDGTTPGEYPVGGEEEELMREAEERLKDPTEQRKARHATSYSSSTKSRKKSTAKPSSSSTKYTAGYGHDEYNVYEANPDDEIESDPVPPKKNYSADIPEPTYSNGHHVREPYSNRYYPNYDTERHKEKAYTSSSSRKKEASPVRDYYNTTIHDATPPESPGAATKKRRPSPKRAKSSGGASKKTTESNVKFMHDPFQYQEPATDTETAEPVKEKTGPTFPVPEFNFAGYQSGTSRNFFYPYSGAYTAAKNSPEPDKQARDEAGRGQPERPKSQPSVPTPNDSASSFNIPLGRAPPKSTGPPQGVKKELYETLLNTPQPFQFHAKETMTSPKKKRSVQGFGKIKIRRERRASMDAGYRNVPPTAESDTEEDEPLPPQQRPFTAAPASYGFSRPPMFNPQPAVIPDLDEPEPMDTTPDFTATPEAHKFSAAPPPSSTNSTAPTPTPAASKPKFNANIDLSSLAASLTPDPGLAGFASDLKSSLPFESRPSSRPPLHRASSSTSRGRMAPPPIPAHSKPSTSTTPATATFTPASSSTPAQNNTTNGAIPSFPGLTTPIWEKHPFTPFDDPPLVTPTPPRPVKIPSDANLEAYNKTYAVIGRYIAEWNDYESRMEQLRVMLREQNTIPLQKEPAEDGKGEGKWISPNPEDIEKYIRKMDERTLVLETGLRRARKEHLKCLRSWMDLRKKVCSIKGVAGGVGGVGYR
ncbi:hypothetical protein EX30DRAFT_385791 [Ascodesmis nigricans]|uniref:J domain-containing protein n=1 Tax=Ascodesmis nigricans TaxID=341454 RepID=A0A4S2MRX0_9PEZI|nr:hypothetical protein EX30DRAFT_385791 [Ascodesmis nigricans]